MSNFVISALLGDPLTIYGDGSQSRSFCYVDDLIEGLVRMMGTPQTVTGPLNLGNPGEFSIAELADLVVELTGTSSPVEKLPLPADDPVRRQPDITLAKKILDWQPTVQLREGLQRTIDYFQNSESAFMSLITSSAMVIFSSLPDWRAATTSCAAAMPPNVSFSSASVLRCRNTEGWHG